MVTKKKPAEKAKSGTQPPTVEDRKVMARAALRPSVNAAAVVSAYTADFGIDQGDISWLIDYLSDDVEKVFAGDMKRVEATLFGQAHALQAIFMSLARRATTQEYLKQWEAYLRMALKAQNQCRMTLETLATIKNPPVVYARQANINNGGQQQVNNGGAQTSEPVRVGVRAPAANAPTAPTGLLEKSDGQWLDTGASGASGRTDPRLAPVGEVDRPANR